jgi:hypothetical protein
MAKNRFFSVIFPAVLVLLLLFSCKSGPFVEEEGPAYDPALMSDLEELHTDEEWEDEEWEEEPFAPEDFFEDELPDWLEWPETDFSLEDWLEWLKTDFPPAEWPDWLDQDEEEADPEPLEPFEQAEPLEPLEQAEPAQPPPAEPPPAQPLPVEQPPAQQPPAQQPPAQQPPVEQPSAQQPPAQQPPVQPREIPPQPPEFLAPPSHQSPPQPSQPEPAPQPVPVVPPSEPGFLPVETPSDEPVISRTVRMALGQFLEIPFRGTGWVYLGELENRRGLSFHSRRLDNEGAVSLGQSFIFQAEAVGSYVLKFYRQDFVQDYTLNDQVQVIVEDRRLEPGTPIGEARVIAEPRWPPPLGAVPEIQVPPEEPEAESAGLAPESSAEGARPEQRPGSQAEYLGLARGEFDAGNIERALTLMDSMRSHFPLETDEVLWLYAQFYEANSPSRDIRRSLECYRRLVSEYPQSNWVGQAQRRINYLERFYFNIR